MKWAVAALLFSCGGGRHEADTVASEVKGPIHARVMEREHEEAADCTGVTGLIERLSCIFRTTPTYCTWLEIDSPELVAEPMGREIAGCQALGQAGPRIRLSSGPAAGFVLVADPAGGRVAVPMGSVAVVAFVLDGHVVGVTSTAWPVDWAHTPTLEQSLASLFSTADELTRGRLLAYAEKHGGEEGIVALMEPLADSSVDRWYDLYDRLQDSKQKAKALGALHEKLQAEHSVDLATGLIAYPEAQPKNFQKLLVEIANEQVSEYADWYTVSPLLEELEVRKDPVVPDLACRIYGMQVLSSLPAVVDEYYEAGDPGAETSALTLVAHHQAPCPWIGIALDNAPCSEALRCQTDGGLPNEEEDLGYDEDGEPIYGARPLCSAAVAKSLLSAKVTPGDDDVDQPEFPGPLLLGAGYAHNAVSKELLARNARRMYRFQYPGLVPLTEEEKDEGFEPLAPCVRPRDLPEAVCRLPLSVTEVSFNGCRLRIDDNAKVVRVEELKPK